MLWNGLHLDIRQSPSLNVFKLKLKTMILIVGLSNFYFVFIAGFHMTSLNFKLQNY